MKCPRCETSVLDEKERDGVTVDVCRECRGMWLDRGELEKLIARAAPAAGDDERRGGKDRDRDRDRDRRRGDDDDDRGGGFFSRIGDLFD